VAKARALCRCFFFLPFPFALSPFSITFAADNLPSLLKNNKNNLTSMAYTRLTAAEAAALIKNDDNVGFSGFTPNGIPKAIIREVAKKAKALHADGQPFQVGIVTGASGCQSLEGDMANIHAIKFRGPFSTNKDFRIHTNLGEIDYEDMHLGHVAERLRRGFYGELP
jgi:acyl-CoA hydrolase